MPHIGYFISRHCSPAWRIPKQKIDFIDLTYVIAGEASYTIDDKTYVVKKGDLLCIPKGSIRSATTNPQHVMKNFAVNFQLYHISGQYITLPFPIKSTIGIHEELVTLFRQLDFTWIQQTPGYKMKAHAIFLHILHHLFRRLYYSINVDQIDPRITKVMNYIYKRFHTNLKIDELAQIAGLNPVYFGTLFKKNTGIPVKKFIHGVRINHAENMIVSGEFSIGEAASHCGFDDVFYFSRVFKSMKGYPPSQAIFTQQKK